MNIPPTINLNFHDFPEPATTYVREDTLPNLTRALLAVDLAKLERVLTECLQWPDMGYVFNDADELLTQITEIKHAQEQTS